MSNLPDGSDRDRGFWQQNGNVYYSMPLTNYTGAQPNADQNMPQYAPDPNTLSPTQVNPRFTTPSY